MVFVDAGPSSKSLMVNGLRWRVVRVLERRLKGVVVSAVDRRVEMSKLQYNCKTWRIERTRV